ncbi:MAG TPA: adenylyltransferase/cytidyltransferase family protein [Candidatus Paceibacterota bacterium]|nr:adenylyltransferase/cytidyltransferase family protein [Candidatus Paceibacterota bacterium]
MEKKLKPGEVVVAPQQARDFAKQGEVLVAVSGGFDPVHIGHMRMFQEARALGTRLVVILNNDHWLRAKKGYVFMPGKERRELLSHIRWVDDVVMTSHRPGAADMSVCAELRKIKPDIFANGGDRKLGNIPEVAVCREQGTRMVFNIGRGGKVQSSSWLVGNHRK